MMTIDDVERMRSLLDQGVIIDQEFSWELVSAVLENRVNIDDVVHLIPLSLKTDILRDIEYIESNDYLNPNPFVNDGLTEADRLERSKKLRSSYEKAFSLIRDHFSK
ncbi:hypothetical protein SAMN02745181_0518 [Rubritalea squalenifaciens DSM 18772]|uniref:Uncharacterized protein n=1 Tax=Rubritalea squalenifaciens DSM 18772 TaxID=1123071 RepID=A0A1M6CMI7_9BACT|nr:hypothetical protein SAMN02745181_0518 [Rubritalea squalenifaciens DSM 18772]